MFTEGETARILEALRQAITARGLSLREVDRRLGVAENSVSQLLRGKPRLRIDHVLDILRVLEMTSEEFWGSVYGLRRVLDRELNQEVLRLLERVAEIAESLKEEEGSTAPESAGDGTGGDSGDGDD